MLELDHVSQGYIGPGAVVHAGRDVSPSVRTGQFITLLSPARSDESPPPLPAESILRPDEGKATANVDLPPRLAGAHPREARKRAEEMLAVVGLEKRVDQIADQFSGTDPICVAIAHADDYADRNCRMTDGRPSSIDINSCAVPVKS